MNTLHLTLKKKWFDMISSGEKLEEYREIKPYWANRLHKRKYDAIQFRNGYGKDVPKITIKLNGIRRGAGIPHWGAPIDKDVYILELGSQLNKLR